MKKYLCLLLLLFGLIGCIGGGTHGYIKSYRYDTSKDVLEKAVHQIIANNPATHQDTVKDYYNNDTTYVTMVVIDKGLHYTYTFRYYGSKEYWDTSKTSEIFIAYAYDQKRKGGSSGNGGVKWYNFRLKKKLTAPFEHEFISKVDSVLGMKHTEE